MFLPFLLAVSLCGCAAGEHASGTQATLSKVDPEIASRLRSRTDDLLRDIVTRNTEQIRSYFSPSAEVSVSQQIERHFNVAADRLRLAEWDGSSIVVEYAPDKRRMQTGVAVKLSEGGRQPGYRVVVFTWIAADEKGQNYYLVPLAN